MTIRFRTCLVALAASLFAASGVAQDITRGSINGVVRDPSGGVIAGARVSLAGPLGARSATTAGGGEYSFPNLVPAPGYTVTVEATGFMSQKSAPLTVRVNQAATVDFQLEL